MERSAAPFDALVAHVKVHGAGRPARRAADAWRAADPLIPAGSPADLVAAAATVPGGELDGLIGRLVTVGGEWAEVTVVAMLIPRLRWMVARWPIAGEDRADVEAELLARVWEKVHGWAGPPPLRPTWALCDSACSAVRTRRLTEQRRRRSTAALADFDPAGGIADTDRAIGAALVNAVRKGRIGRRTAAALWATRIAGVPTEETARQLGTSPAAIRVMRSRAAVAVLEQWAA